MFALLVLIAGLGSPTFTIRERAAQALRDETWSVEHYRLYRFVAETHDDPEVRRALGAVVRHKLPQVAQLTIPDGLTLWPRMDTLRLSDSFSATAPDRVFADNSPFGYYTDAERREQTFIEIVRYLSVTDDFEYVATFLDQRCRVADDIYITSTEGNAQLTSAYHYDQYQQSPTFTINTHPSAYELFDAFRTNPGLFNRGPDLRRRLGVSYVRRD